MYIPSDDVSSVHELLAASIRAGSNSSLPGTMILELNKEIEHGIEFRAR